MVTERTRVYSVAPRETTPAVAVPFRSHLTDAAVAETYPKGRKIFAQGDSASAIFYVQKGKVKLSVFSRQGKEAVIAILGKSEFIGEACLAGQLVYTLTATTMSECSIVRLEKSAVYRALFEDPSFAELFLSFLLARNIRTQEDLIDHIFNSSEKRLARALLLLANFGKESDTDEMLLTVTQETLAEMVGTTRPRISFFLNKFHKLGFIHYRGRKLRVNRSLLTVVLQD